MAKILMIISPERFRDEELFVTKAEFDRLGYEVVIASTKIGTCLGSRGGNICSDYLLKDVITDTFDAIVFVGGRRKQIAL